MFVLYMILFFSLKPLWEINHLNCFRLVQIIWLIFLETNCYNLIKLITHNKVYYVNTILTKYTYKVISLHTRVYSESFVVPSPVAKSDTGANAVMTFLSTHGECTTNL